MSNSNRITRESMDSIIEDKILIPQEFGGGFIRDEELDWLEP